MKILVEFQDNKDGGDFGGLGVKGMESCLTVTEILILQAEKRFGDGGERFQAM